MKKQGHLFFYFQISLSPSTFALGAPQICGGLSESGASKLFLRVLCDSSSVEGGTGGESSKVKYDS